MELLVFCHRRFFRIQKNTSMPRSQGQASFRTLRHIPTSPTPDWEAGGRDPRHQHRRLVGVDAADDIDTADDFFQPQMNTDFHRF